MHNYTEYSTALALLLEKFEDADEVSENFGVEKDEARRFMDIADYPFQYSDITIGEVLLRLTEKYDITNTADTMKMSGDIHQSANMCRFIMEIRTKILNTQPRGK